MWSAHLIVVICVIEVCFLIAFDARYLLVAIEDGDEMQQTLRSDKKGKRYKLNLSHYGTAVASARKALINVTIK